MERGDERRWTGNWGCNNVIVIMCLVWAALSSVLTCRAINWLMEYIRCSAGVASEEKAGGMRGPGSGAAVTGCPQRMQLAGV